MHLNARDPGIEELRTSATTRPPGSAEVIIAERRNRPVAGWSNDLGESDPVLYLQ